MRKPERRRLTEFTASENCSADKYVNNSDTDGVAAIVARGHSPIACLLYMITRQLSPLSSCRSKSTMPQPCTCHLKNVWPGIPHKLLSRLRSSSCLCCALGCEREGHESLSMLLDAWAG